MFPSRVNTLSVPIIATALAGPAAPAPAVIVESAGRDLVVKVRNNSFGQYVLLSFDAATLQAVPARTDTYKLPAGAVETFILACGQSLFVSTPSGPADGSDAEVTFHVYESIPIDNRD